MSNLLRLLAGGLLAGWLWSALFGYPYYSYWPDYPWPLGLLDLTALATSVYLGYLAVRAGSRRRRAPSAPLQPAFWRMGPSAVDLTVASKAQPGVQEIAASDPDFDLTRFGEFARQVMAELYEAWNRQDLEGLSGKLGEGLLDYLRMGLKLMHLRGEVSHLEDLHLHRLVVVDAGREHGREFITLWIEGEALDYILQKGSYKLVSGSLTYPVSMRETWRFERPVGQAAWKLVDMADY
ncbi:MAG: TIM44-like domain-containing protein [Deltaproteobacteria bacterium]|nr:TIM44-like domain-containing protein [Deltaproteobacteria bacterium]